MKLINAGVKFKEFNLRNIDVANDLDVSEKAVSEWVNGKSFPNDKSLNYLLSKVGILNAETDEGKIIALNFIPSNPPLPPLHRPPRKRGKKTAAA